MSEPRSRADRTDRIVSASAAFVAISALVVSMYQTYLMRQQQKLSAWPYLTQGHSWRARGSGYSYVVTNNGVGPALVGGVEVLVDGKPQPTWGAAARGLVGTGAATLTYSSFHRGSVLLPGAALALVEIPSDSTARVFWLAAQKRLRVVICYCSLYDDCWRADSEAEQPSPVRACEAPRGTRWGN